jgi:hypothetical protein
VEEQEENEEETEEQGEEHGNRKRKTHPTPVHLHRELKHIPLHLTRNIDLLGLITNFKQLLNHIIPKDIHHQRKQVWSDFS